MVPTAWSIGQLEEMRSSGRTGKLSLLRTLKAKMLLGLSKLETLRLLTRSTTMEIFNLETDKINLVVGCVEVTIDMLALLAEFELAEIVTRLKATLLFASTKLP